MGEVYRARDPRLDRDVVVRTGRAADPTGIVYLFPADVSPRTGAYVYSYIRTLSDLSLAEGLR